MDNRVNIAVVVGVIFVLAFAVTLTQSDKQVESQVNEDEIPEELIYEIRVASETEVKDKSFEPRIVGGTEHKVGGFSLGDRVEHKSFGEGVILNYEGEGSNARVEVNFDNGGTKWLVLSFANLEKI